MYSISSAISVNRLYRDGSNDLNKDRVRRGPGLVHQPRPQNDAVASAHSIIRSYYVFPGDTIAPQNKIMEVDTSALVKQRTPSTLSRRRRLYKACLQIPKVVVSFYGVSEKKFVRVEYKSK